MSSTEHSGEAATAGDDQGVADYLSENPDFFERHAGLLEQLRLPHHSGAATVSLVERQVSVLQDKNRGLERRLRELVQVARDNSTLSDKIHALAIRLLRAGDQAAVLAALEAGLREDFGAHEAVVVLFYGSDEPLPPEGGRFLRHARRGSSELLAFGTFMQQAKPRCGRIRDVQRDFLFPGESAVIASVAMVPLGAGCELGMLAIGSSDPHRFNPTMSTDFLARIGDLASAALAAVRQRQSRAAGGA
ncbi:DUF484 family protein [Thioalkalivibrio sp. XN8]|uniref:DUF484 family protein n=1 Tax=Thioalkalivibrio sp. XN8 TaxID=2712863 RepID=UPI0013EA4526|nr:DUF484 family protein [Thioalkalivibrio sp. XN8]